MAEAEPKILSIVSRPFGENTFVAWREGRHDCLVIDPGLEPALVIEAIESHQLTPAALLITHGHSDHIGGNAALKRRWPDCPIVIGTDDAEKLTDPNKNLSARFGKPIVSPPADRLVNEGDTIEFAGYSLEVREIPGHSVGPCGVHLPRSGSAPRVWRRRAICRQRRPLRFSRRRFRAVGRGHSRKVIHPA